VWHRAIADVVIGSLASGYVNANNIGIPVAVYVLGNAAYSAPVVLLQLLVFTPIALTILDIQTTGTASFRSVVLKPLTNPLIIGSALGVLLAVTRVHLPAPVLQPFQLLGGAAVPVVLLGFGMSLHGQKILQAGSRRRDVLLASALKLAAMPLVALAVAGCGGGGSATTPGPRGTPRPARRRGARPARCRRWSRWRRAVGVSRAGR
jgi:predicted permease